MKWMIDALRFGKRITSQTPANDSIRWSGDKLTFQDMQFTMSQFQSTVQGIVNRARDHLSEEVLLLPTPGEKLPPIPWDSMDDDAAEDRQGWFYACNMRNVWGFDESAWLWNRIWEDSTLWSAFLEEAHSVSPSEAYTFRRSRVEKWMDAVVRMKEYLLVLLHLTGGGPARASELLSIRYRNTENGGIRNQFIDNGFVSFTLPGGYNANFQTKLVYRFVPREVGELFVYFQLLALPFQRRVEILLYNNIELSGFIWPEKELNGVTWTSERFKRALERETQIGMGAPVNISLCRRILTAIARRYLGALFGFDDRGNESDHSDEDEEDYCDRMVDLQARQSGRVMRPGWSSGDAWSNGRYEGEFPPCQSAMASMAWFRVRCQSRHETGAFDNIRGSREKSTPLC